MGRAPCCEKVGLKKGRWTAEEDQILTEYIKAHGEGSWRSLPKNAGLLRCGKSCRLRWVNYLREDLKRGNISAEEEETILKLQATLGNRWSIIAGHLPGRTDNEIKNYWNAHLSKKVAAARTAAGERPGDGESRVHAEDDDDNHPDDGEVCSEDSGSTVVDADRDDLDDAVDDSVDSSDVLSKAKRKGNGKKSGGSAGSDESVLKRKKKANKKRESSKDRHDEPMKEQEENNNINNNIKKKNKNGTMKNDDGGDGSDSSRKRKTTCGGTDSCCHHSCASKKKKKQKQKKKQVHASTITDGGAGSNEEVNDDSISNSKKKRRKVSKPANQPGSTDTEPRSKQAIEVGATTTVQAPCRRPLKPKAKAKAKAKQEPDAGASAGGAAGCHAVCGPAEGRGPLAHVEHVVEGDVGDLQLDGSSHVEDTSMGVDLLEAFESDDAELLVSGGSMVQHDNLLLDYLDMDMSCTDAACCPTAGALTPPPRPYEEVDSVVSGWPSSPPMPTTSVLADEAMFASLGSCSTSSSCVDLVDLHLCAEGGASNTAGAAVDDTIGSLPWEAGEDFWRLLSEFAGDMVAAGPAPQEEAPPCTSPHQPMAMTMQGLYSNAADCGGGGDDDAFADDALDNSWLLADMFLS